MIPGSLQSGKGSGRNSKTNTYGHVVGRVKNYFNIVQTQVMMFSNRLFLVKINSCILLLDEMLLDRSHGVYCVDPKGLARVWSTLEVYK